MAADGTARVLPAQRLFREPPAATGPRASPTIPVRAETRVHRPIPTVRRYSGTSPAAAGERFSPTFSRMP